MKGFSKPPLLLSAGLFILGVISVLSNPARIEFITFGMILIGLAMVNLALSIPVQERKPVAAMTTKPMVLVKPVKTKKTTKKARKRRK